MTTPADDPEASPVLLPGFEYRQIDADGVTISCAVKGTGPPGPTNHFILGL